MSDQVRRLGVRRPACYLVEAPGGEEVRYAVEAALAGLDWACVDAPGHADALLVAGVLPGDLEAAAELLWAQLPGPRVRLGLDTGTGVREALAGLPRLLASSGGHDHDADERAEDLPGHSTQHAGSHHEGGDDTDAGHADHEMSPSGIPLAEGADDRDGLEMDQLGHPWGPVLHRWPGGLELRMTLRGDVVAEASASWFGERPVGRPTTQQAWDAVATTLSLAGDERHARRARAVRDDCGRPGDPDLLRRRIRRLRRWRGLPDQAATTLGDLVDGRAEADVDPSSLVIGHDLADARLLVAAHAPLLLREPAAAAGPAAHHHDGDADG